MGHGTVDRPGQGHTDECVALEVAVLVVVHDNLWRLAIDILCNQAESRKVCVDLIGCCVEWEIGDVYGSVDGWLSLLLGLLRLGCSLECS